jgi:hypothetical protein
MRLKNIATLESKDLAQVSWDAIEPIWGDLPYSESFSRLNDFMNELTEGQRYLISLDWCQKKIRNGGFKQFFENSTGNLVPWAIPGFSVIGAKKYSELLEVAASMLGSEYPTSRNERKKIISGFSRSNIEKLESLTDQFIELLWSDDEDLEKYRGKYVKDHPDQFVRL